VGVEAFLQRTLFDQLDGALGGLDEAGTSGRLYVLVRGGGHVDHFSGTPCGVCSVIDRCEPGGVISPRSCVYLSQWLEW